MRVAYRRMSGAIGISDQEKGTRGLWWEKRRLFFDHIWQRGHSVHIVNKATKSSEGVLTRETLTNEDHDFLFIEFGSNNFQFYGKDLIETEKMVEEFNGPIAFICDDPDLQYRWSTVSKSKLKQFSFLANAKKKHAFGNMPISVPVYDFPISSLGKPYDMDVQCKGEHLVYLGRPNGREKIIKHLMTNKVPFKVFGRKEEWSDLGIRTFEAPDQPQRAFFYSQQLASLVLSDSKHKQLGWRTGRAYHAAMAGCPAVVEAEHTALSEFLTFKDAYELNQIMEIIRQPLHRKAIVKKQQEFIIGEKSILDYTMRKLGL